MLTQPEEDAILTKTKDLCSTILAQAGFTAAQRNINSFMNDEAARSQYEALVAKGQALQKKQGMALALSAEEVDSFEQDRAQLMNNHVARGFVEAQEALRNVHQMVSSYLDKTMELGRVPADEDFEHGCGDHGCGCQHH